MFAHDLKPLDTLNYLLNYADDASLLSPENTQLNWKRQMSQTGQEKTRNLLKTVELFFCRPNVSGELLPPTFPDINRMCDAKLLGS